MSAIRHCPDHGFFDSSVCPVCGTAGEDVLDSDRRTRLSKFVSGALRHFPDDAGLTLDDAGWVARRDLVDAVTSRYDWATETHVEAVVAADPKGRFELDGDRVRAAYGHSVDVDLGLAAGETPVPDRLFHGTAPENLPSIRKDGLKPMERQKVHLSGTREEAKDVGARHTRDPIVLVVDTEAMRDDGHRIVKRGTATYTTDRVPPTYLHWPDE